MTMIEIKLNGLVYVFDDDMKVIELLDANADDVREESNDGK